MARPQGRTVLLCLFPVALLACSNNTSPDAINGSNQTSEPILAVAHNSSIVETLEFDDDGDGTVDLRSIQTSWYDAHGNTVRSVNETDYLGPDGMNRTTIVATYSKQGNLVNRTEEFDRFADGTIDRRTIESAVAHDHFGNPTELLRTVDLDANGTIDAQNSSTLEYDHRGNLIRQAHDTGTTSSISYDAHGNPVHVVIESPTGTSTTVWDMTRVFNPHGALVEEVSVTTWYGGVDRQTWSTTQFDRQGNPIEQAYEAATQLGVLERGTRVLTYDVGHRLVGLVEESDHGANGTVDQRFTYSYEYTGTTSAKVSSLNAGLMFRGADRIEKSRIRH